MVGVDPAGAPCRIEVMEAAAPVLLLFLSAACLGCRDLWEGLAELHAGLAGAARLAVVTRSAGDEDPAAIAALTAGVPPALGVTVVMSSPAFAHYRVAGPRSWCSPRRTPCAPRAWPGGWRRPCAPPCRAL